MLRQPNMSNKALKERAFRKKENERKRFDKPLRQFLQLKYQNVLQEYTELYELMNTNHPKKRNLLNTKTFRDWVKSLQEQPPTDILTASIRETLGEQYVNQSEMPNDEIEAPNDEYESCEAVSDDQNESVNNENDEVKNDEVQNEPDPQIDIAGIDIAAIDRQVDQIMNELLQEEDLRAALEGENNDDDEGIEISVWDELALDIEPFDYTLEVEGVDW